MKRRPTLLFQALLGLAVAASMASCHPADSNASDSGETYLYTDDYQQQVSIPRHPRRVVSLSPAVTEILFALGADSLLVGRTEFCLYPLAAAEIENIGGISNLNVEKVLSCKPDLIISGSMIPEPTVQQFERMGVPLVSVIEKSQFEGLYENISKIGSLVGFNRQADSLNAALKARMSTLGEAEGEPKSCYYVVGYGAGGNYTAGGNTFINDLILLSGGRNIAEKIDGWTYSLEALMQENPDYIIIRREDSAAFVHAKPYSMLRAVRNGHVIGMESGMIDLQVPRNIDAVLLLRQRMDDSQ